MILLNKAALSNFGFGSPGSLLFFQCAVCAASLRLCGAVGAVKLEPWSFQIARLWLPVNVLFVAMLSSSSLALRELCVPMVTVLKNLTNLFTIGGEYVLFGKVYGAGVWVTLALMTVSAICGAATDLSFSLEVTSAHIRAHCSQTLDKQLLQQTERSFFSVDGSRPMCALMWLGIACSVTSTAPGCCVLR